MTLRVDWSLSNVISVRSLPVLQLVYIRFVVLKVLARLFEPNLLGIRTQTLTSNSNKVGNVRVT